MHFLRFFQFFADKSIFFKKYLDFKFCDVTKIAQKLGFLPTTHYTHVRNFTAQLILYLGIVTQPLSSEDSD